ncbi:hypothetical protein ACOME3_010395 [Neoechinorhynchus agilis]
MFSISRSFQSIMRTCILNRANPLSSASTTSALQIFNAHSESHLNELLANETRFCVIDFFASWCHPCKVLSPRLEKVMSQFHFNDKAQLVLVDIERFEQMVEKYAVDAVPTLVALDKGKEKLRLTGLQSEAELKTFLDKLNS